MTPTHQQIKSFLEALLGSEDVGEDQSRYLSPVARYFLEGVLPKGVPEMRGSLAYLLQSDPQLCGRRSDLEQIRDLAQFLIDVGRTLTEYVNRVEQTRKERNLE